MSSDASQINKFHERFSEVVFESGILNLNDGGLSSVVNKWLDLYFSAVFSTAVILF